MRVTIGGRGSGISTNLLLESAVFKIPIVCGSLESKIYIARRAEYLGIDIPEPISLYDNVRGKTFDKVLIDNTENLIKRMFDEKGMHIREIANAGINIS